ncbi:hypothetical protein IV203_003116 [Nitzschia inconspicua]|uniref:Uncharacterized protein n=1 Tax=Nitzschia inconspicua TaxID=303405 RepID=A0A9K3L2Y3_9STRA|nr:hypothetical protein IV203_003116 [Nitzschia inconspicua]
MIILTTCRCHCYHPRNPLLGFLFLLLLISVFQSEAWILPNKSSRCSQEFSRGLVIHKHHTALLSSTGNFAGWYHNNNNNYNNNVDNEQYGYGVHSQQQQQQEQTDNPYYYNGQDGYGEQPYQNQNENQVGFYQQNENGDGFHSNQPADSWYDGQQQWNEGYNNNSGDYNNNNNNNYYNEQQSYDSAAQNSFNDQEYYPAEEQGQYYDNGKNGPSQQSPNNNNNNEYSGEYYSEQQDQYNDSIQPTMDAYQEQQQQAPQDYSSQYATEQNDQYYYNNDNRQEDFYREQPQQRPGGWQVRIEERSYRPPQQAARNRRRSGSPLLGSFLLDDFFGGDRFFDSAFDRMFSSPFDMLSPFGPSRRRWMETSPFVSRRQRPRRRRSPIDSMMMDLMVPPSRSISPFTMFDRSIDDKFRSMMRNSMPGGSSITMMMANDPMFQRRLLEQAERLLNADIAITTALGSPIQMGPVISQSSSSSAYIINGRQTQQQQNQLQVSVRGSRLGGVVRIVATQDGIQNMVLSVVEQGGYPREINVRISDSKKTPSNNGSPSGPSSSPPDIVDAEIVDKDSDGTKPVPTDYWAATV